MTKTEIFFSEHEQELTHCPYCGDALNAERVTNNRRRAEKKVNRRRQTTPILPRHYTLPCTKDNCVCAHALAISTPAPRDFLPEAGRNWAMAMLAGASVEVMATLDNNPRGDVAFFDPIRFAEIKVIRVKNGNEDAELPKQPSTPALRICRLMDAPYWSGSAWTAPEIAVEHLDDLRANLVRVDKGCPGEDPSNRRYGWSTKRIIASGALKRAEDRWTRIIAGDRAALLEWLA